MSYIFYNGKLFNQSVPILKSDDRSYRYGDGFFETIRVAEGSIPLLEFHRLRIEKTIHQLNYKLAESDTFDFIFQKVIELCKHNNCEKSARVRLSFSNGNGGLFDANCNLNYIIEAWPLQNSLPDWNTEGLKLDFYQEATKSCTIFSNIKSSSSLLYTQAAKFAKKSGFDDCIILNQYGNICESIIANIFWIKNGIVFTPPLSEGCVDGVMRSWLLHQTNKIIESPCTKDELLNADEIFLTNAIRGIQWVKNVGRREYDHTICKELFSNFIRPLFAYKS